MNLWKAAIGLLTIPVLAIIISLVPSPLENPKSYTYPPAPKLEGPLAVNHLLQRTKRLFENETFAPESFTADSKGNIYTGMGDGRIMKIANGQLHFVTRTGRHHSKCGMEHMEHLCGRPNSLRMDADGNLIVADAYKGLLKVLLPDGGIEVLIAPEQGVEGIPFKFLNGLEIGRNGQIYFTESTTKWERRDHRYDILELNNFGRLMVYDPKKKEARTILRDLYFANGIALSPDESYVLISETSICRVIKYYISSSKVGQKEVFLDNLPGYPDNIRRNVEGNYYIAFSFTRFAGKKIHLFLDYFGPYPSIRSLIAKFLPLSWYDMFLPEHSIVIEVNKRGEIIRSLHDPVARVIKTVTDVFEYNGSLYIGSFDANFIGLLDLAKI